MNYIIALKNKIIDKSCPIEFINKKTIPVTTLLVVGVLAVVATAVFVAAIFKPFLSLNKWEDVYLFSVQALLGCVLLYFVKNLGMKPVSFFKLWLREKREHLRAALKYFLVYCGLLVLLVSIITTAMLLLGISDLSGLGDSKIFGIMRQKKEILWLIDSNITNVLFPA